MPLTFHPGEERSADSVLLGRRRGGQSGRVRIHIHPMGLRLTMRVWNSIQDVKQKCKQHYAARLSWMRLFAQSTELHNSQRLIEIIPAAAKRASSSSRSATIKLVLRIQNPHDFGHEYYVAAWGDESTQLGSEGERLLASIQQGLAMGFAPQLVWDGTGGTYILRGTRKEPLAAFKPRDEEAFA